MGKLLDNKGLLFSTLSLLVFFLIYIAINLIVQTKTLNDASYADAFSNLSSSFSGSLNRLERNQLIRQLNSFKDGVALDASANQLEMISIDDYLYPDKSNIQSIISDLDSGKLGEAQESFNSLSLVLQRNKDRKLKLIRYLQIAAAILAILIYLLVVVPFIVRVTQKKESEVEIKRETTGIMNTVSEGLFLLNHDHEIGVEQSASLKGMFKSERDLEGDFFDFIGQYVPQNTLQIAKDYLDLLFGDRVKEKLVQDLNPLNEVEINIVRRDGSYESRFLDFRFNRVVEDGRLSHLLGSVTDVTRRVLLERELVESKEEQEAQLELLMSILHVDNDQLNAFFTNADESLTEINNTLESRGYGNREIRAKIAEIARNVHRLKGDSAALGLHKFEFTAHALEDELDKVTKDNEVITGKQLLPAITKLKDLFAELENMRSLVAKFAGALSASGGTQTLAEPVNIATEGDDNVEPSVTENSEPDTPNEIEKPVDTVETSNEEASEESKKIEAVSENNSLQTLASTVAERTGKRAILQTVGMGPNEMPVEFADSINSIAVQLVRNSIVHGCLSPEDRLAAGKTESINIRSSFIETEDDYQLIVRDDGEGFNNEKIIKRAIELKLITSEDAAVLKPGHVMKLAFSPGFSTLKEAEIDGGRGVGLDVVHAMVKKMGGNVFVKQKQGQHCQFKISIPKSDKS